LILSGYLVNVGLGQHLGPTEFGRFTTMASLMVLLEVVFLLGIPRALSKHVAETGGGSRAAVRWCGCVQLLCGGLLFLALFGFARPLAVRLNDPGLAEFIRVVAWAMPAVAVFRFYTKLLNGLAAFGRQAASSMVFSVLRPILTLGLVALGAGTLGALWALVLTDVLAALAARMLCRAGGVGSAIEWPWRQMADFAVRFAVLTGAMAFLVTADQLFVKALMGEGAQAGLYAAAAMLAKIPRFVAFALSATVFPLAARSTALQAHKRVMRYVRLAIRSLAVLLLPLVALVSAIGRSLLTMLFGSQYSPATQVLWALMLGSMLLGLFNILSTAVAAAGGVRPAMLTGLLMVLLDSVLCLALIPWVGIVGAALAMVLTALTGCLVMLRYIAGRFGSVVVPRSWARVAVSSAIVGGLACLLRGLTGVWLLLACAVLFLVYFGILAILGEIRAADVRAVFSILPTASVREAGR